MLGQAFSHDRVLSMSADIGNSVISHFESVGTACLPSLDISMFTTSAVDSIDQQQRVHRDHYMPRGYCCFSNLTINILNILNRTEQKLVDLKSSGKKVSALPDVLIINDLQSHINHQRLNLKSLLVIIGVEIGG